MNQSTQHGRHHVLDPDHAALLLDSFRRVTGRELFEVYGDGSEHAVTSGQVAAERLYEATFCVLSHGTQADPVLNYGNARTLALWEMTWEQLIVTPSRLTAEPLERTARQQLLDQVTRAGYVGNYAGIRISRSGRRFRIVQAYVWNIIDADGHLHGQAAAFANWEPVAEGE